MEYIYIYIPSGYLLHSHGFSMALIEIDGLPNLKMGGSFHGKLLTRWEPFNPVQGARAGEIPRLGAEGHDGGLSNLPGATAEGRNVNEKDLLLLYPTAIL